MQPSKSKKPIDLEDYINNLLESGEEDGLSPDELELLINNFVKFYMRILTRKYVAGQDNGL